MNGCSTDVYPDGWITKGESMLVRYGIVRMRWRDGPTEEAPRMEPASAAAVALPARQWLLTD